MPYALYLERFAADSAEAEPPPFAEWTAAVAAVPGTRLYEGSVYSATNPMTGDTISMHVAAGSAEVFFPDKKAWHLVFIRHPGSGSVSFDVHFEPGDQNSPVWMAAVALASQLGARISGDEGEFYDLQTGAVLDE